MNKKMISLEIQDDLREALRIKAFNEHTSISKIIRQTLEKCLAQELEKIKEETNRNENK